MDQAIYTFTVPIFIKSLGGLKAVLTKASESGVDESVLLHDQLAPDMFPLIKQVQVACDNAKGAAARLSGGEIPKYEDAEQTISELQARIDKTLAYLATISAESFAGAEERKVILPYFADKYLSGFDYAREYAIPNFFFHLVTAYAIVRKNGVPIGKAEYANGINFRDL